MTAGTCGATTVGMFGRLVGPCLNQPGHPKGSWHRDDRGTEWREYEPADTTRVAAICEVPHQTIEEEDACERQRIAAATNWFDAGCGGDCRKKHTRRPGYCALVPPPEPTVSILRVEDTPELGRHIATRSIPVTAWDALITVAKWVSRGRSFAFEADPDIAPCYPDAAARRALGALHDAGLLDQPKEGRQ